jgi:hypothetical protein
MYKPHQIDFVDVFPFGQISKTLSIIGIKHINRKMTKFSQDGNM